MKCFYHAERDAVAQCAVCEKNLCSMCVIEREEKKYCKNCIKNMKYPVKIKNIAISSLICGVAAGALSAFPGTNMCNLACCLWIVVLGALAVYIAKKINSIEGKIPVEKAALTGALTGFVASLVMWGILQIETFGIVSESILLLYMLMSPIDPMVIFNVGVRTGLFALFGALGGIISNEVIK